MTLEGEIVTAEGFNLVPVGGPSGRQTLRARYVVGADGANSFVRGAWALDARPGVLLRLADRRHDPARAAGVRPARMAAVRPGAARPPSSPAVPAGAGGNSCVLPDEDIEDLNRLERAWELLEPWGVHPGNADAGAHAVYPSRRDGPKPGAAAADDRRRRRPPDAALRRSGHVRRPAGRDGLAWRLGLILHGKADDAVLDSYGPNGRPDMCGSTSTSPCSSARSSASPIRSRLPNGTAG